MAVPRLHGRKPGMYAAIDAFLRHLKVERNSSPLTVKSYAEDLDSLLAFFGDDAGRRPEDRRGRHRRSSASTSRTCTNAVTRRRPSRVAWPACGACSASARREGLIDGNPAQALRTPRTGRKLPHFLTGEQVATLIETPTADTPAGRRDRAILEVFYSAGPAGGGTRRGRTSPTGTATPA